MVNLVTETLNPVELKAFKDAASLRAQIKAWRLDGYVIGFVPTMGALHQGHLDLVRHAKTKGTKTKGVKVVASIFVNPKQFAPTEDLDRYPRQEAKDLMALSSVGCDGVYLPQADRFYPEGFDTKISTGGPSQGLEQDFRPHFFDGVTTVVAKLFLQVAPDFAVFGEKDYQQLMTLKAMVRDLDMPLEIIGYPTVRESDGLALSSRNAYLSPEERAIAPKLYQEMQALREKLLNGNPPQTELEGTKKALLSHGFTSLDYLEICDSQSLKPWQGPHYRPESLRLLAAVWLGKTRLIDNIDLSQAPL